MYRQSKTNLRVAAAALCVLAADHAAGVQPSTVVGPASAVEGDPLEGYLAEHGLLEVLSAHLRQKLGGGSQEERVRAAELLGKLYVRMLGVAATPQARQEIEEQSRELLKVVPEANSFELRINLAKATYLPVEEIVERDRLRIASKDEKAEAERVLRSVGPVLDEVGDKLHRRVEQLESKEAGGHADDFEGLRAELAEARRLRSLSRYYAGWTEYYLAVLTNTPQRATAAMQAFGTMLNAVPGRPASIDRMPKNLLRYEHVARAAIGCGLSSSILGNEVEAVRWLEEVENADGVTPAILDHVFSRKLIVFAAAERWADVELAVRRRRRPDPGAPEKALTVAEARLLAVLAFDAVRGEATRPGLRLVAEKMGQLALGDLVVSGEVGHVLDLVSLYGTTPIGEGGFIVSYVRSLQAFESARAAHKLAGGNPEEPAVELAIINQYQESARLLALATVTTDADDYPGERVKAEIRRGLALYYAGDMEAAATQFEAAAGDAASDVQKRDALWYAIVALDRAVEGGRASLAASRDRIATLYLRDFPGTENAAKLLLRQSRADRLSDQEAIEILLKLPRDSPVYEAGRRQVARMLYQAYRRAPASGRDFAAVRFADIAEEVLKLEQARAMAGIDASAREAGQAVILRVRQLADALLALSTPDPQRAESALTVLDSVAAFHAIDLKQLEGELAFRKMQVAMARGDEAGVQRTVDRLRAVGGVYSATADRLLYARALRAWKANAADLVSARQVVRHGLRVLEEAGDAADPATITLRDHVAGAAAAVWRGEADVDLRTKAIALDKQQLESGQRTAASLRRLGELLESTGDEASALAAWRELLAGTVDGSADWYEARYQSLRLLVRQAPGEALQAMQQHKVLHPEFGPDPWGPRLRELDAVIAVTPIPPPASVTPGAPAPAPQAPPAKGGPG